jgi:hypothetical protein
MFVNTKKSTAVKSQVSSDGKVGVKCNLTKYNNNNNNNIIFSSWKCNLYKLIQLSKGIVTI